ncbi:Oxidoreductase family, NAD-binding Rossmann fold [Lachnospiraceae bacterium NE2001]|nr:Oxidoreductase family, NAD-binding Rossmann fold [Lachnospiraceae bacterium NE2001]
MYNIVLVGVGALGKRHLSSILNTKLELNIYCYDINIRALDGFEFDDKYNNKSVKMITSLEELPREVDFALFAMTSNSRREMFDRLINQTKVSNILFEKFLFQRIEDYEHVGNIIKKLGINAWVNCARRQMDCYQKLKSELSDAKEMRISISGGEWGLACNAIHELDLISFLSDSDKLKIDSVELLPGLYDSKRKGYKEVYGTIRGSCGKCNSFSINCMKDTNVPDVLVISTDISQYYIIEGNNIKFSMRQNEGFEICKEQFDIPFQSQMTQFVLEDILLRKQSKLSSYFESSLLHIEFMKPLLAYFKNNGLEGEYCPIT